MGVEHQKQGTSERSKLKFLVPSVSIFFTPLLLEKAFIYQDSRRRISSRRFVAPSFNDIRLTLNSAQVMSLIQNGPLGLVTFDGDVTLYEDGQSLSGDNPVIPRILQLLLRGIKVGIVTAAGYTHASKYYDRLLGLLEAVHNAVLAAELSDPQLVVLGGESNYLFSFDASSEHLLKNIPREEWMMDEMKQWTDEDVAMLLDVAEAALSDCISSMGLSADILRKERAVGIIQKAGPGTRKFTREQLEETVLVAQQTLDMSSVGKKLPFCAFNGKFSDIQTNRGRSRVSFHCYRLLRYLVN
jgi:IMP and pyridine-specific 5'-nucleotidase